MNSQDYITRSVLVLLMLISGFPNLKIYSIPINNVIVFFILTNLIIRVKTIIALRQHNFKIILTWTFVLLFLEMYSTLLSKSYFQGDFITLVFSDIVLVVFALSINKKDVNIVIKAFVFGAMLSNLLVIINVFFLSNKDEGLYIISSEGIRLAGYFGNVNAFSGYQIFVLPLTTYLLLNQKIKVLQILYFFGILLAVTSLILAQSRSALLSLPLVVAFLLVLKPKQIFRWLKSPIFLFSVLIFVIISYFTIAYLKNTGVDLQRIGSNQKTSLLDITGDNIKHERISIYSNSLNVLFKFPLGVGQVKLEKVIGDDSGVYLAPHNFILALLLTYGVFGGIVYTFYFGFPVFSFIRVFIKHSINNNIYTYISVGYFAYLVNALSHITTKWLYLRFFWVLLLISMGDVCNGKNEHRKGANCRKRFN